MKQLPTITWRKRVNVILFVVPMLRHKYVLVSWMILRFDPEVKVIRHLFFSRIWRETTHWTILFGVFRRPCPWRNGWVFSSTTLLSLQEVFIRNLNIMSCCSCHGVDLDHKMRDVSTIHYIEQLVGNDHVMKQFHAHDSKQHDLSSSRRTSQRPCAAHVLFIANWHARVRTGGQQHKFFASIALCKSCVREIHLCTHSVFPPSWSILEPASTTEDSTHATCRVPEIAMINCHYMWAGCFSRTICAKLMNMGDMPDSPKLCYKRTCLSFEIVPTRPHACTANDWDPCIKAGKCLCISCWHEKTWCKKHHKMSEPKSSKNAILLINKKIYYFFYWSIKKSIYIFIDQQNCIFAL